MPVAIAAGLSAIVAAPALVQNAGLAPAAAAADEASGQDVAGRHGEGDKLAQLRPHRRCRRPAVSGSTNWKKVLGALKVGQWTSVQPSAGHQLSRGFAREIRLMVSR